MFCIALHLQKAKTFASLHTMKLKIQAPKENIKELFLNLKSPRDLANLLEIKYSTLVYHLYQVNPDHHYQSFSILKKSGELRNILAPITTLKILQRKLNYILEHACSFRSCVHGFILNKNIVSNAEIHCKKTFVFNIDLLDFFPSINFGRVRGMFIKPPYSFPTSVATVLAQICCYKNQLPQGAPTSPIISNMICAKMDGELQRLAGKYRCDYTRYADDITFSTFNTTFTPQLCRHENSIPKTSVVGDELLKIIHNNGFKINDKKVRLQYTSCRQSVTGLITNEFPNIKKKFSKQIRSMLYDWDKYGLDASQKKLKIKYGNPAPFKKVLKGKIEFLGMVRGKNDALYQRYLAAFNTLDSDFIPSTVGEIFVPMQYDAFISHASEDKQSFVEPLINLLNREGFNIWYDRFCIEDGASIPLSINQGMAESKYGIFIFSNAYFKKAWPQEELAGFMTKQMQLRKNIILPIWYGISLEEMINKAPLWAHRYAHAFPKENLQSIAKGLTKTLKRKA